MTKFVWKLWYKHPWGLGLSVTNILYLAQVQTNSVRDMKFWQIGETDIERKEV